MSTIQSIPRASKRDANAIPHPDDFSVASSTVQAARRSPAGVGGSESIMPAYHQMGHDSENLLWTEELSSFGGAILSPVNYGQTKVMSQIEGARDRDGVETIFDPQLYVPNSDRGCLREWPHFPDDFDTADPSADSWWEELLDKL